MTKADLVNAIAAKTGLSKVSSEKAVNASLAAIKDELLSGGKLTITGFGTFAVKVRGERKGRNPRTGKEITIPETKVVTFSPSRKLKDSIK